MAFQASKIGNIFNRAWSIGPVKVEFQQFSALAADTSGSLSANALSRVYLCIPFGLQLSAFPTISAEKNVALAFNAPGANCDGYILLIGA